MLADEAKYSFSSRGKSQLQISTLCSRVELTDPNRSRREVKEKNGGKTAFNQNFQKLMPKFVLKSDDISLFLKLFERKAKVLQLPKDQRVTYLIGVLPVESLDKSAGAGIRTRDLRKFSPTLCQLGYRDL
ncbi:hypothetical protein TNCV_4465951 [Trichonephila clavipes]|nr:hypothetical protein TNCV_4465951 [Trichonephila clavipes]